MGVCVLYNDLSIGPPLLGRSLFTALPIIYGIVLELVEERLMRYVPTLGASRKSVYLYVLVAILVVLGLFLFAATLILHPSG